MKKVISMNLINVIQMKTQSFWLTALLVLLGVFSTVNTNAAEKLMAGTGKVNITMGHRTKRFFQWSGKMGERF